MSDSDEGVDTEPVLPLSAQAEQLASSCDTYMSQQSHMLIQRIDNCLIVTSKPDNEDEPEEETVEDVAKEVPETAETEESSFNLSKEPSTVNSSLEVEVGNLTLPVQTDCDDKPNISEGADAGKFVESSFNLSLEGSTANSSVEVEVGNLTLPAQTEQEDKSNMSEGQECSPDVFLSEKPSRKRRRRIGASPSPKKSRQEPTVSSPETAVTESAAETVPSETPKEEKHPEEVVINDENEEPLEGRRLSISSEADKTVVLSDSQEFSLRIEDSSQPELLISDEKINHESSSWKSHSKEKNVSPGHNSLSQKSGGSWSSHHNHDQSLSWSSHKGLDDKPAAVKSVSLSPEDVKIKDVHADCEGKVRVVMEERLVRATVQMLIDEETNKVISAEVKQMSLMEEIPIEKPGRTSLTSSTSAKSSSSSGSVGLPGPFALPGYSRLSMMSSVSSSTSSSTCSATRPCWDGPFRKPEERQDSPRMAVPESRNAVSLSCGFCSKPFPFLERTTSPVVNGSPKLKEEERPIKHTTPKRIRKTPSYLMEHLEEESSGHSESQPQAASTPTPRRGRGRPRTKTPKNGVIEPPKAKTAEPLPLPDTPRPVKKIARGEPVMARWADGRYYPGWVSQAPGTSNQVLVKFCDGKSKVTSTAKVVSADVVMAGSCVLVGTNSGEYEEALVVQVTTTNGEPQFKVERDKVTRNVPFSHIALLENQVSELTMTDAQKAAASINFNDLSLENIMSGPRKRAVRTPLAETTAAGSPIPLKKKKKQMTPEPSTSHGQTFNGPDDYGDTDSSTHSSCSLDLRGKEMKPLDVECSPPEVPEQSRDKLSLYRHKMAVKSKKKGVPGEPEHILKMLGPIPEEGSNLFSGYVFLITYTSQVELNTDVGTGTPSYDEKSTSEQDLAVWKTRLRTQIKRGGGKVYHLLSQVTKEEMQNTYLITDKPCNTPLYLQCLVNNIPIYSVSLIVQCCTQNRPFKEMVALRSSKKLQAGYSLTKKCCVKPRNTQPLRSKTVLLALSGEASVTTFWECIVKGLGGTTQTYRGGPLEEGYNVIVTDPGCEQDLVAQACEQKVPLVSLTWLQQCVINGEYQSPTEHPLYKYNSIPGSNSPDY